MFLRQNDTNPENKLCDIGSEDLTFDVFYEHNPRTQLLATVTPFMGKQTGFPRVQDFYFIFYPQALL